MEANSLQYATVDCPWATFAADRRLGSVVVQLAPSVEVLEANSPRMRLPTLSDRRLTGGEPECVGDRKAQYTQKTNNKRKRKRPHNRGARSRKLRAQISYSNIESYRGKSDFPKGGILHLSNAVNQSLHAILLTMSDSIMNNPLLKIQHKYPTSVEAGSINLGMVTQLCMYGGKAIQPNTNIKKLGNTFISFCDTIGQVVFPILNKCFDRWKENWFSIYKNHKTDLPCLSLGSCHTFVPYNGFQLNINHGSKLHRDPDIECIPCFMICLGKKEATIRLYKSSDPEHLSDGHTDIVTKPGDVLLMDSTLLHEVIDNTGIDTVEPLNDKHGFYINGRTTIVMMANRQYAPYVSQEFASNSISQASKDRKKGKKRINNSIDNDPQQLLFPKSLYPNPKKRYVNNT